MPTYTREFFNGPVNSGENSLLSIFSQGINEPPELSTPGYLLHTCPSGSIDNCHFDAGLGAVTVYLSGSAIDTFKPNGQPQLFLTMGTASNIILTGGQSLWIHYSKNSIDFAAQQGWIDRITGQ